MSFGDIKGQDSALLLLKESIKKDRVFSSYLFVGPDGVGKKLAAENLAKAVNCLSENTKPCDSCNSCKKIDSQGHPDVFFIEPKGASSSIGIEEIRTCIARANLKPYEGKKKVFIINNAHSMNAEAQNTFLKTLEEAPQDTIFVLISRSKERLFSTIVSRCHAIRFFSAPVELVESVLKERYKIGKNEARILARFSSGRVGEALRMKEENLIDRKNRIIDALSKNRVDLTEKLGNFSTREELKGTCEYLTSFFRDVFLYKVVACEKMIFHIDKLDKIKTESNRFTLEDLDRLIKRIITLRSYVDYNVNTKLIIDVLAGELRSYYA